MLRTWFVVMVVVIASGCVLDEQEGQITQEAKAPPVPAAVTYWVKVPSTKTPKADGSQLKPFPTVAAALAKATAVNATSLTIQLMNGTYSENVNIDRPTSIIGETRDGAVIRGTISNSVFTSLRVENLTLKDSPNGAVTVLGPCEDPFGGETFYRPCPSTSATVVRSVSITAPVNWGIRQAGGTVDIYDVSISDLVATVPVYGFRSGAAIHLYWQSTANIENTRLQNNPQGLVVQDSYVRMWAGNDVSFSKGRVPGRNEIAPAIEISNGAVLVGAPRDPIDPQYWYANVGRTLTMFKNAGCGIAVFAGGSADLDGVLVQYTQVVPGTPDNYATQAYVEHGTLRLSSFHLEGGDSSYTGYNTLSGVNAQQGAVLELYRGNVKYHLVGITHYSDEPWILSGVFTQNLVNVATNTFPLPPLPPPL
jgi:hypothetical protein